jgi:hypothetical protein
MFLGDLQIIQELPPPRRGAFFFLIGAFVVWAMATIPTLESVRISTNSSFVEEHPNNVELWSPGNPIFPTPEITAEPMELPEGAGMKALIGINEPLEDTLA